MRNPASTRRSDPAVMAAEPAELRRQMVQAVMADDSLAGWRAAFTPWRTSLLAMARHRFIPHIVWIDNYDDGLPALGPLHCEQGLAVISQMRPDQLVELGVPVWWWMLQHGNPANGCLDGALVLRTAFTLLVSTRTRSWFS